MLYLSRTAGAVPSVVKVQKSLMEYREDENKIAVKLKHKDSFGKSENLSKIFFAEILVFDHDYEGKSSSSNGLL